MEIVWVVVEWWLILDLAFVIMMIRGLERRSRRDRLVNRPLTPMGIDPTGGTR